MKCAAIRPLSLQVMRNKIAHSVRAGGDLRQSGPSGGLMFGLHYLRKDQLHTFRRNPGP